MEYKVRHLHLPKVRPTEVRPAKVRLGCRGIWTGDRSTTGIEKLA